MAASNRWLAMVGGAIAIAVVIGIAVTMLAGGEREYAEGTPERTVQDYLRAVIDRDHARAMALLAPDLATRCERATRSPIRDRGDEAIRATLDRADIRGGTAEVRVRLTTSYGSSDPFSTGEYTRNEVFVLQQADGKWRFTDPPWPLFCPPPPLLPPPPR